MIAGGGYFLVRDEEPFVGTGRGRCSDLGVKIASLGMSSLQQGQMAPVTAADIHECSMETLKLMQEFLGTHNIHIREMFYII